MPGVKDWLKKASSDLKASKRLSDDDETLDCSAYHTHQCAEKALKAFIVFAQKPIPKTHDLGFLLDYCTGVNIELVLLFPNKSKVLNSYGHESRYPNDDFFVNKQKVDEAIQMAEEILITVKNRFIRS